MPESTPAQPYVGLRPYTEADAPIFFGRERETAELLRLVEADIVTVLYGVSGVGKSSLLCAGLLPRLRPRDYLPVVVRLDHEETAPRPQRQVLSALHAAAAKAGVLDLPAPREDETLWEYFHHPARAEYWTADHRLLTPLLALDQFEEFFSLGQENAVRRARGHSFRFELLDLLANRQPANLDAAIAWQNGPARWRLLLSLREDFVAQLLPIVDELAEVLPSVHRQKLRLLPFDAAAVREVVEKPWAALGRPVPESETALTIAERWRVDEGGIPPAQLFVLLTGAQERLVHSKAERLPAAWFAEPTSEQVRAFLDNALRGEPPEARRSLEEQFISAQGYRTRVYEGEVAMPAESLARLAERGLLNYHRGAPGSYELAHDLLGGVLRASRNARRAAEEAGRLAEAEQRAAVLEKARRRAVRWGAAAGVIALVAIGALVFALAAQRAANAAKQWALNANVSLEKEKARAEAGEKAADAAKQRAVAARKAADELIRYMQYDLRTTLASVGRLSLLKAVDERIARYRKDYPPEAGDLDAEREQGVMRTLQGDVLFDQGNLAEALAAYREHLVVAERLVAANADNALWQNDLSISYERVGNVLVAQGQLADAVKAYRDSLAIRERLAKADPDNAGWQGDLAISYDKVGDVLVAQGQLADALKAHRDSLAIGERLAKADPDNAGWQRDLSISYDRVGEVLVAQGQLADALKAHRDSLAIGERLAKADPDNAGWQRDLSVGYERVGDVLVDQGQLADALKAHRDSLAIRERLAKADPDNAGWQRDLSVSYNKVGEVLVAQGQLADALKAHRDSLAIRERLAKADPDNAGWQRDLSVSYEKVGDVLVAQGQLADALKAHRDSLAIRERLAKADPDNAGWQRDLSVSYNKVGEVLVAQGQLADALKAHRDSLAIRERLAKADPDNAGWQRDLSVSYNKVGEVLVDQGQLADALKAHRDSLAIGERLAKADPDNAGWQRDLAISYERVGDIAQREER